MTQQEQKQKEIRTLTIKMLDLVMRAAKVAIKPRSNIKKTNDRRMIKIIAIVMQVGAIKNQIKIV